MSRFFGNIFYYIREACSVLILDSLSNLISLFSTGLVFFILSMVLAGWQISSTFTEAIRCEAEISVYLSSDAGSSELSAAAENIRLISGVNGTVIVNKEDAYDRMTKILGKDSAVLKHFDNNPFQPFIEVKINLEDMDGLIKEIGALNNVEYVRDNRDILENLKGISDAIRVLGYLIVAAVGFTTLVIVSHIIRSGIYSNREQINTLRLLGAPELFIGMPYLISGSFLAAAGGAIGTALSLAAVNILYGSLAGPLPFIPLPLKSELTVWLAAVTTIISMVLGVTGSLFGFMSSRTGNK